MSISYTELANAVVQKMPVYEPGKPIEYVAREFGIDPSTIEKMASNENPFGASPKAVAAAQAALAEINMYPDGGTILLRERLAKRKGTACKILQPKRAARRGLPSSRSAFMRPHLKRALSTGQAFTMTFLSNLTLMGAPLGPKTPTTPTEGLQTSPTRWHTQPIPSLCACSRIWDCKDPLRMRTTNSI